MTTEHRKDDWEESILVAEPVGVIGRRRRNTKTGEVIDVETYRGSRGTTRVITQMDRRGRQQSTRRYVREACVESDPAPPNDKTTTKP